MLYYDRIDIKGRNDLVKSNNSKEYMICNYYFFNHGFKLKILYAMVYVLTMLGVNISNIAIITIKNVDYCCNIHNLSKCEAINLLKNSFLEDRGYI